MQKLLAMAQRAMGAICVVDGARRIRFCNREAEELVGDAFGRLFDELFEHGSCADPALERALAGSAGGPFPLRLRAGTGPLLQAVPLCVRVAEGTAVLLALHAEHRAETSAPDVLGDPPLTQRETEVLQLLIDGWDTQRIASTMAITRTTVRNHVQRILRKLGAHSKLEAVATATRLGLRGRGATPAGRADLPG